jgi:hypothetical protein
VITFMPLLFVSGVMGKFIAVMPFAFIATLLVSLSEAIFVLPGHLAHEDSFLLRAISFLCTPLKPLAPVLKLLPSPILLMAGTLMTGLVQLI